MNYNLSSEIPTAQIPIEKLPANLADIENLLKENASIGFNQSSEITRRKTWEFGYIFQWMREGNFQSIEIPKILINILESTIQALKNDNIERVEDFNNVIISDYTKGPGLQPHIDVLQTDQKGFYFGPNIIGLILLADETGGLFLQTQGSTVLNNKPSYNANQARHLKERNGLAYMLNGQRPREKDYHGVSPISKRRVSLTFRTTHFIV